MYVYKYNMYNKSQLKLKKKIIFNMLAKTYMSQKNRV